MSGEAWFYIVLFGVWGSVATVGFFSMAWFLRQSHQRERDIHKFLDQYYPEDQP